MQLSIPQIPIPKGGIKYGQSGFLMHLHDSPNYGQLGQRYFDYHDRHLFLNQLLREIYTLHALEKRFMAGEKAYSMDQEQRTIRFSIENVIYWLRKNIDDMIGLYYYLHYFTTHHKEPAKLKVSSIGGLLNEPGFHGVFGAHLAGLGRINEVSNTFKHSFLTAEVHHLIGKDEPVVNCLDLKHNSLASGPNFHSYCLRDITADYVAFFVHCRSAIEAFDLSFLSTEPSVSTGNP